MRGETHITTLLDFSGITVLFLLFRVTLVLPHSTGVWVMIVTYPNQGPRLPVCIFRSSRSFWIEALSMLCKGSHSLPMPSTKCLVTSNYFPGNGFSCQSHGLKHSLRMLSDLPLSMAHALVITAGLPPTFGRMSDFPIMQLKPTFTPAAAVHLAG